MIDCRLPQWAAAVQRSCMSHQIAKGLIASFSAYIKRCMASIIAS